jgi:ABC-type transport system substrate-binding protein
VSPTVRQLPTTRPGGVVLAKVGQITIAVASLPTNFNPSTPAGSNRITAEVMAQVWPQTFVTDNQFQQILAPGAVDSAEVIGVKPFTVSYTIDPKAVWSDGVPITAADFIYNWHEQLHYAPELAESGFVAGYRAVRQMTSSNGGRTLTVTFRHNFAEWESLFADLVPAHVAKQYGWVSAFDGFDPTKVISGGPFEITSFVPGREVVLSRNPHWWLTPPRLSRIVLKEMPRSAALAGLANGTVALAEVSPGPSVTSAVADGAAAKIDLVDPVAQLPYIWQLCFNMTDPVLSDATVRRAIAFSIDRGAIVADSAGLEDSSLSADDSRLTIAGEPGTATARPVGGHFVRTALHLFSLAGYAPGGDGYLRIGGVGRPLTLSLLVPTGDWTVQRAAEEVVAQLQGIGVKVVLETASLNDLLGSRLPEGRYQLALAPFLVSRYSAAIAPVYSTPVLPVTTAAASGTGSSGTSGSSTGGSGSSGSTGSSTGSSGTVGSGPSSVVTNLPWSTRTVVGREPGAVVAGVVTRDVFGLNDATVDRRFMQALSNLSLTTEEAVVNGTDARLWAELPTIPLFQEPVSLVHEKALIGVSEGPTLAGPFWNAETWAIQLSPAVAGSGSASGSG